MDDSAFEDATRIVREQLASGADIEDVLRVLKVATGGSMIQAIGGVWKALNLSLVDARMVVETSPAFDADAAMHSAYRETLLARLGLVRQE
jgi:hypothetical protein